MAACALGVDLGLHNGGPDYGRAGDEKAGGHALEGEKRILALRMSGYTSGSRMGIMMIMPRGLRLLIKSLGTPWSSMVAACEVRLLSIWL
jgi:hypothetical protein